MIEFENSKPFTSQKLTETFVAIDIDKILDNGQHVRATALSNLEYKIRFGRLEKKYNMKAPPNCEESSPGYLVIGKLGTPKQYETWIPDHLFDGIYEKIKPEYAVYFPSPFNR